MANRPCYESPFDSTRCKFAQRDNILRELVFRALNNKPFSARQGGNIVLQVATYITHYFYYYFVLDVHVAGLIF
ncbi:hypothetical protein VHARVF571_220140 [Vibrio harveyi]|nr:hypothetical protein VHARVF571_220140 [Vibrio harveyi]